MNNQALDSLEKQIGRNLPANEALHLMTEFSVATTGEKDLSKVWPKFAHWLLVDPEHGVVRHADSTRKKPIRHVASLYAKWIAGNKPSDKEWQDACDAAAHPSKITRSMDSYSADAAYAAYTAAEAAFYGADVYTTVAVKCCVSAIDGRTAQEEFYCVMADKLIELLKEAK